MLPFFTLSRLASLQTNNVERTLTCPCRNDDGRYDPGRRGSIQRFKIDCLPAGSQSPFLFRMQLEERATAAQERHRRLLVPLRRTQPGNNP